MKLSDLNLFTDETHRSFLWKGEAGKAALLVHGFPGTPAEIRPWATALHERGWTVQGPLLPGFGPEIDQLFTQRKENWITAVSEALAALRADHDRVLLLGYSMGGAVALNVAAQTPPDGLILVAPFWRVGTAVHKFVWEGIRRLFPEMQPFKGVDFSRPQVRHALGNALNKLDLEDPQVQAALRELRIPMQLPEEIFSLGAAAKRAAAAIQVPALTLQGRDDPTIRPADTHELLRTLRGPVWYKEVVAEHDLWNVETAVWPGLAQAVTTFADQVVTADL